MNAPYQTPLANKVMPLLSPIQEQSLQSPYQNLFTIRNTQQQPEKKQQTKSMERKQLHITQPPTQVKSVQLLQKQNQQFKQIYQKPNIPPTVNASPPTSQLPQQGMIELIRQNQELKQELLSIESQIEQYKNLLTKKK